MKRLFISGLFECLLDNRDREFESPGRSTADGRFERNLSFGGFTIPFGELLRHPFGAVSDQIEQPRRYIDEACVDGFELTNLGL